MKFKIFFIASLLMTFATNMNAQNYNTAVGVRAGLFNGVTFKQFISLYNAIEGIVNFRWDGVIVTGLYEWQNGMRCAPGFDYVLGLGAHVGIFDNYKWDKSKTAMAGVDALIGIEYTFPTAPFTLGLDYKPAFNFVGDNRIWADGVGLSFKFNIR